MRVLQCVSKMDCGGIETKLMNIYRNINRDLIQFDFLVQSDGIGFYDEEIYKLGGRIYHVTPRKKSILKNKRDIRNFFREHTEYEVVHAHLPSLSNIEVLIAAKMANIKTIIAHSRNSSGPRGLHHYLLHRFNRLRINRYVTHKFAISDIAGYWLFGKNSKFTILKNSLDAEKYVFNADVRARMRKNLAVENKFVIGHIGRFHTQKNHTFLIDVFSDIYKNNKEAVLLLIGEGSLMTKIKDKVNSLGLENRVHFLGVRSDVPDLLQAMDVFLFPSLYEGFGNVLVEAQAAGLACITSDQVPASTGVTDLIEYVSLSEPASVWANRVLAYQNGYIRRNTLNEVRAAGFDNDGNIKWLERFYLEQSNREY
ncbi:MAG TPA: glycosyltransferase family 1 protein [Gallicola sp.]|nr:glycosyltransferase family 1 protein [Gallicola sp.]